MVLGLASADFARAAESESDAFLPEEFSAPRPLRLSAEADREARAAALFLQALFEEESEGPDKALSTKRRVLALDPGFTELAIDAAHQYLRRGENTEAISVLKDAAKANPDDLAPPLALSAIYLRQLQKPELAERYALQALQSEPDNAAGYEALWEVYRNGSSRTKIESLFNRAGKREFAKPEFWLQIADLRMRDAALDGRTTATEIESISGLLERAASDRANAEALAKAGDYYVLLGRLERAAGLYSLALKLRPTLENIRERLAGCLLETGDTAEAIVILEEIVKENPLEIRAYDQLAKLHLAAGDRERALSHLRQSLLLAAPEPRRFEDVIQLSLATRNAKSALEAANEAVKKFPRNVEFQLYRAIALSEQDQHEEAIKAFEQTFVAAMNSRPDLLDADFFFGYGVAAEQAGRIVKASELFKKSIELDPANSARACNYLGYMWADRNENLDEAEELIRRAVAMEPNNGAYLDSLGWVLFRKGRYEEALQELLRAAAALKEPDAVVFDHIGDAYEKLGKTAEAVLYWQKALQVDPANSAVTAKLDRHASRVARQPAATTPQTPAH